jgi:hypothetical protein
MFKKKEIKDKDNMLDYIPVKVDKIKTKNKEDQTIDLIVPRDGWFDSLVRKIAKTPERKVISLDDLGSGVWRLIDNKRNIGEIALIIKDEYGEKADPLYKRLLNFIRILKNNEFIEFKRAN